MSEEGIEGIYRTPATPDEGIRMEYGGPITQKFLETIEHNNNLINQLSPDVMLKNVNGKVTKAGLNKPRKHAHKRFLDRDIVFWGDIAKISFGDATQGTKDGFPAWKGFRYDFPNNGADYFHDAYLPVVVTQIYNNPNITYPQMTLVLTRIATNFFKFDVYELENGSSIGPTTKLWLAVFAMGRRGDYWEDVSEKIVTPISIVPQDPVTVVPDAPSPGDTTPVVTPPPNTTNPTSIFRSGSPWEKKMPSNAPAHANNSTWLAQLDSLTDGFIGFVGGVDNYSATSFDTPIYRVTSADKFYYVYPIPGGNWVPDKYQVGGTGIRIPEIAKAHFTKGGAQSSDAPMCIYSAEEGYYANFAEITWDPATSKWEAKSGSLFYTSSYGVDSGNTNENTISTPSSWPTTLSTSGVTASTYQDDTRNHGSYRGNPPHTRVIDYNRLTYEGGIFYATEVFFPAAVNDGRHVFPMTGNESRSGFLPYGCRLRINPSVNVRARLVAAGFSGTRLEQLVKIGTAWQDYGVYVGDTTGSNFGRVKLEALHRENRPYDWKVYSHDMSIFRFDNNDWIILEEHYDP